MSPANIIRWQCQACAKEFDGIQILDLGAKLTSFTSRKTGRIILFQSTDDEYGYAYYEATERRARQAFPDLDLIRAKVVKRSYKTGDSHRFDTVFRAMMSFYLEGDCIHCASIASPVKRWTLYEYIRDGFEIISVGDEIAELIRAACDDYFDTNDERTP